MQEVNWNSSALGSLVLGDAEKRLLIAMVASENTRKAETFDDFIEGKGMLSM